MSEPTLPDILAYLRRRHANAALVAEAMKGRDFGDAPDAIMEDRRRQLEIIIAEIEAGFHIGEAAVADARALLEVK